MDIGCKYSESIEFDRHKCKVAFFNSCNPLKKIFFSILHGRNFVPTQNEMTLVSLVTKQTQKGN